jgi:4-hydroxybenzoyl-CoA thioesterase
MSQSRFESIVVRFPCQVHWGDCDPAAIIFYPTYFRWFDAATWNMFAAVGYDVERIRGEHRAMPLVAANCDFKLPARQGERCEVRSRIARWGGKSFSVSHEVVREEGGLLAAGGETRVWARHASGPGSVMKGETITEELKALFRAK